MIQIRWKTIWTKIYCEEVSEIMVDAFKPLFETLGQLADKLSECFTTIASETMYGSRKRITHTKQIKPKINTLGFYRIEKHARSSCRK